MVNNWSYQRVERLTTLRLIGVAIPVLIPPALGIEVAVSCPAPMRETFQVQVIVKGEVVGVLKEIQPGMRTLRYLKVTLDAYATVAVTVCDDPVETVNGLPVTAKVLKELICST